MSLEICRRCNGAPWVGCPRGLPARWVALVEMRLDDDGRPTGEERVIAVYADEATADAAIAELPYGHGRDYRLADGTVAWRERP